MEKVVVVGIDISKDDIHACVKESVGDAGSRIRGTRKFLNSYVGFTELPAVLGKQASAWSLLCIVCDGGYG
ncbi:hypothetical protein EZS27_035615 [termite gut metagenome]|uniref:Uncharacterized protein n=1 Tax=termite gut metagenome TaxID=433724 RepID=A0A5J4PZ99_9ZZZZ